MVVRYFLISTVIIQLMIISAPSHAQNSPLRIAVSSNFSPALKELLIDFNKNNQITTQVISGASGAMFLQIMHGAPFDIFLSADTIRPKLLEQAKLIVNNSRQTYAYGQLALFSAKRNANISLASFQNLQSVPKRFAIANPNFAPYGIAAKQVLQHLQLWQHYQNRLIKGINISQTFQQVRSQSVSLGLVANSQLVINNLKGVLIPQPYYQPIQQQLVILKSSKNKAQAEKFVQFLLSDKVQQRISQLGYAAVKLQLKPHLTQRN